MTVRKHVFQYRELNANAGKQHLVDEMPLTQVPIKWMMNILCPEIKTLDDLAEWCAMPKLELQDHIAWFRKRFTDFTDNVHHDQCFSHLDDAQCIWYHAVAILVTSFQWHKLSRRRQVRWYLGIIEERYGWCGRNCVTERRRRWKTWRKRRDGGGII